MLNVMNFSGFEDECDEFSRFDDEGDDVNVF